MKTFRVTIPLTGNVVIELGATSAEEAKEAAFSVAADALGTIIKDDKRGKATIENLELLGEFDRGNFCVCPSLGEIEADEI